MDLCETCGKITLVSLYPPNTFRHAENYTVLAASAETCRLCKMIQWCIDYRGHEANHNPTLDFEGASHTETRYGEYEERNKCSVKLQIIPGDWNHLRPKHGFTHIGIWMMTRWMVSDLTISVEEGDKLGLEPQIPGHKDSRILGRILTNENPPKAHLDVAKGWLLRCESRHRKCGVDVPSLPPRVIYTGHDGQQPRLVETTRDMKEKFATLSYCWGGVLSASTTTSKNLRANKSGINMETLPKTLREAVIVCRALDILYIWIDSLCIVQDDKDDWLRHSSLMGNIYHDSTLTIAAADAPDSSVGLFIPRGSHDYCYRDTVTLSSSFANNRGTAYITGASWGVYGPPRSTVAASILQTRGWCMQEREFSRRTLNFLQGEMVWHCCEQMYGQSGFKEPAKGYTWLSLLRTDLKVMAQAFSCAYDFDEADYWNDGMLNVGEEEAIQDVDSLRRTRGPTDDSVPVEMIKGLNMEEAHTNVSDHDVQEITDSAVDHDDSDGVDDGGQQSFLALLIDHPAKGRASQIVDLRQPADQPLDQPPPSIISRTIDNALYNFLDMATRETIYHVWYSAVGMYSSRRLTFPSDKLPALAGIASRVQAITYDTYLAGHFRRELERSLFWMAVIEPDSCTPQRVKEYRAPSWAWPSMEGHVSWNFPDVSPGMDEAAPIEILSATAEVEREESPFGGVRSGEIVLRGHAIHAHWSIEQHAWMMETTSKVDGVESDPTRLMLMTKDGKVQGHWSYDDELNGLTPGSSLTSGSSEDEQSCRRIPSYGYAGTPAMNERVHGKEFMDKPLWERGTYTPEEVVLVKGPTRRIKDDYSQKIRGGSTKDVAILVLCKAEDAPGKYRRVGVGGLAYWNEEEDEIETLSVI